ncbi:ABC transporter permease [Thiohalobacter sp. COW1]|uniref:ABC transporter ATP-binding protein n=1 Tax=Thiohalobacter sp. COW1 TaxID=2795687 RepID=UPI001914F0A3|nr:ABC transporter ATP-binding protein [Thiohalobacter sp. COW1]BCO31243.1 ABC transporter permease [Thiohalobacter sp. COW1]
MRLMLNLFRAYPLASFLMLVALLLSGLAEGLGLSALLPVLKVALYHNQPGSGPQEPPGELELMVLELLDWLGIPPTLGPLLLLIVVASTFKALLLLLAQRQVGYTAAQLATDLRLDVLRHMMRSRWAFFLHQPVGKLTNTMASEAQRASDAYVNGATAITFLIQSLVYAGVAVAVSWQAALASLLAGVLIIGGSHFLVRMTRRAGRRQTQLMISLMSRLTDTLQSVKPLKAMAREDLADRVLNLETNKLNKALRRQVFSAAALNSAQDLMFTAFIALGVYLALEQFSMGLATVMVLVVALGRAFSFLGKVQKQYQKLMQGESAYWSLLDTIDQARRAEESLGGGTEPVLHQGIRFEQVGFAYDGHEVFSRLDLEIPVHSITTLIGPSGSGKTTIIDLVIGLLRPDSGRVRVDGTLLEQFDLREWRRQIGYVPQETVLLHDSILHNVTLGDPQIEEAQVVQALQDAGAWDFVQALPAGMHTQVGERGGRLSGGQRQRIAIARALINRPQLLILDEATSALDPASEQAIVATLRELRQRLTILAISHNPALAEAADRVYRLAPRGRVELQA